MAELDLPARADCPECGTDQAVTKTGAIRKHKTKIDGVAMPCTGGGTLVGVARIPRRSRAGYYRCHVTGEYLRSVTTILSMGSPKPALVHWAGNLVAETAMDNLPYLVKASRRNSVQAYDWLRRAHTRKKDERADLGTAVHDLVEAHVLGTPVPEDVASDPELRPFLEHFHRFVDDFEVTFEASEMVVANYTDAYAGTLDFLLRSPCIADGALLMGDTKTGGELDVKGVYPEAGVQMSAYANAEFGWMRNGDRVPFPDDVHDVGVVLHLRPEGYRLVPVRCGADVFAAFKHIRHVADFNSELSPHVVGGALPVPTNTTRKAAA